MRVSMVAALAVIAAIAIPAQARAGTFHGVVVAKQSQRSALVLAGRAGAGLTVHVPSTRAKPGDRVAVRGSRMRDGTIRAARVSVISHARRALIRGVVVRQLRRSTLLATGHSVITIRHAALRRLDARSDHGGLRPGTIAEFRVRFDDDDLIEEAVTAPLGQAGNVQIEGRVVSVAPLVVSVEGLPITITVPAGMTLPAALAAGARIELIVQVAAGNVFTLVAVDEIENENQDEDQQEVEVKGFVVNSTATQLVVNSHGTTFTFAAPAGVTLPILPAGTFVEVKGVTVKGMLTLERLKLEDGDGDGDGDGGGDGGGGGH